MGSFSPTAQHQALSAVLWVGARTDDLRVVVCGSQQNRFITVGYWSVSSCWFTCRQTLDVFPFSIGNRQLRLHQSTSTLLISDSLKPTLLTFAISGKRAEFTHMWQLNNAAPSLGTAIVDDVAAILLYSVQQNGIHRVALPVDLLREDDVGHSTQLLAGDNVEATAARLSAIIAAQVRALRPMISVSGFSHVCTSSGIANFSRRLMKVDWLTLLLVASTHRCSDSCKNFSSTSRSRLQMVLAIQRPHCSKRCALTKAI